MIRNVIAAVRMKKYKAGLCLFYLLPATIACSQVSVPLNDLSFFQDPGPGWRIVSDVTADLEKSQSLDTTPGSGILVNLPGKRNPGKDLFSVPEYGDLDLELDYMMARNSNSGIYLQGRYEVQLLDSWGVKRPTAGDNGGIYERWDESRGEGNEGFEGYAPRQNVSLAPGLWQHLKISFQAPRFDASGRKTENARMLSVELNGVVIHENIELFGPTRGATGDEGPLGPLRIQGDHGPVAFRNIRITSYGKARPEITGLKYEVYNGKFNKEPDFSSLKPGEEGMAELITAGVSPAENEFCIRYTGTLQINEPGEYDFRLNGAGGACVLKIGDRVVIPLTEWRGRGKVVLPGGTTTVEIIYMKYVDWARPALGLSISGPGIREFLVGDSNTGGGDAVDPILVGASENRILRSFMDLPGGHRVVHAVSVGSPQNIHYTYDMDNGAIVQLWHGEFLDATPMWHSRGDGSSRPAGAVEWLGTPAPAVAALASPEDAWPTDTTGTGFRTKGYILNAAGEPTFRYRILNALITDATRVLDNGHGIERTIAAENSSGSLYVRLARGKIIETVSEGLYLVDDKAYYLKLEDHRNNKPVIREANGGKEIIVPIRTSIKYSIIF